MGLYSTYSDAQLAARLQRGDDRAFTEIYHRHWEKLFAIAYHYSHNKEISEEIIQEIFLRLWDKREAVLIENLPAYLATACKFGVFKHTVRQKRRELLLVEHMAPTSITDDEAMITARFLEEYIRGVVDTLPDQCRVVYQLRREQDLSIEEIAKQLDISPNTARNHLNKALKTIRLSLRHARLMLAVFA